MNHWTQLTLTRRDLAPALRSVGTIFLALLPRAVLVVNPDEVTVQVEPLCGLPAMVLIIDFVILVVLGGTYLAVRIFEARMTKDEWPPKDRGGRAERKWRHG